MAEPLPLPRLLRLLLRIGMRLALIAVIAGALVWAHEWINVQILSLSGIAQSRVQVGVLAIALLFYALLIAIPFVPGVEIGIALLLMEGAGIAPFVWLATVLGLFTAFVVGHHLSLAWLSASFRALGLRRVADLIAEAATRTPQERLLALSDALPRWLGRSLVGWRYVVIALLVNLPGTITVGGGGGILLLAGLSRLFSPHLMLLTLGIAASPVPLAVWLYGTQFLR